MRHPQAPKITCPWCGYRTISRVVKSDEDRRIRLCSECGDTFSTVERPEVGRRRPHHVPSDRQGALPLEWVQPCRRSGRR